jgi:hypothetical protein
VARFFLNSLTPHPQDRRFIVCQLHHQIRVSQRRICGGFMLSPLGDPVPWSHGMCHIWSSVAAGCGTHATRSGRLVPYHGRIHLPSRWTSHGRGLGLIIHGPKHHCHTCWWPTPRRPLLRHRSSMASQRWRLRSLWWRWTHRLHLRRNPRLQPHFQAARTMPPCR